MFNIKNYTDTKCELEIAKTRLNWLMDKKAELYCKYFPISPTLKDVIVDGGERSSDKMPEYLHELYELDVGTGMSLAEELQAQQRKVNMLQNCINDMNESLSKMTGIEYQLFYEIIYKGVNVSKAVDNIAIANEKEPQTIWKNYYKKIKYDINKIRRYE